MYHPNINGPKIERLTYEQNLGLIDEESIFRLPEEKECIMVYSDKTPAKDEKKKANDKYVQIDSNPFETSQMRPYVEYSTTSRVYTPENNTQWGAITTGAQSNIE